MSITRIQNNQITDSTIVAYAKIQNGSLTGNLFAPTVTLNSNVTINGNLFLANTGNTITINATNTYINDPLVVFNSGYTGSLSGYDIGILVNRNLSSMAPYGSVNTFWGWVENDQAFEAFVTTDTGTGATSLNNSGYANIKVGNSTVVGLSSLNTITGASFQGIIGNVTPAAGTFTTIGGTNTTLSGTLIAATVNAATIGNIGAKITGDGGFLSNLVAGNISGTSTTANVSLYDSVTAFTTNQTFYPQFSNIATTGNTLAGVSSSLTYNPSTGTLSATNLSGTLTATNVAGTVTTANVAYYEVLTNSTSNATFYPSFFDKATGNAAAYTNTALNFNPSTGTLAASAFSGGTGSFTTLGASGIVSFTNSTNNTGSGTGAVKITGGAWIGGNLWIDGNLNLATSTTIVSPSGIFTGNAAGFGALYAGISSGYTFQAQTVFQVSSNFNGYAQINSQNINSGALASSDYIATANNGTANDTYIDMGIASSGYNYPGFALIHPNDGYVIVYGNTTTGGGNLLLATSASNDIIFATGGFDHTNEYGRITDGNIFVIRSSVAATSEYTGAMTVAGGVGIAGALYTGGIGKHGAGLQNTPIGNATPSTAAFTTLTASGVTTLTNSTAATGVNTGALQVTGGASVAGNLWVGGNVYAANIIGTTQSVITVQDPLLYLQANTPSATYNYDIGFYSDYTAPYYVHTGLARNYNTNVWTFFSNIASEPTATGINWSDAGIAYDSVKAGSLTLANNTTATNTTSGALVVTGGAGIGGALYAGSVYDNGTRVVSTSSGAGNLTISAGAVTLPATGPGAVTTGSASAVAQITTDAYGRISSASSVTIAITAQQVSGTIATANVAMYDSVTASSTNATFYPTFYDKTSGNAAAYTNTSLTYNPSTGALAATSFTGTVNGTVSTANVSLYDSVTAFTTNQTFYPQFSNIATTGNSLTGVSSSLSFNPSTGALTATSFNGVGTLSTLTTSGVSTLAGNVVVTSGTDMTSTTTGALMLTGSGGLMVGGNAYVGNNMYIGSSALSQQSSFANPTIIAVDSGSNYAQIALKNTNSAGSADFAAYADNGTDAGGWVDVGVAGSVFSDGNYTITKPQDGYIITKPLSNSYGGNLIIGTSEVGSYNDIVISSGAFHANAEVARFHGNSSNSGTFVVKLNTTNTAAANTGAFQVWGGESISGNSYIGGGMIVNGSQTSNYDFKVRGTGTTNLLWARPNTTYDTVIVGSTLAAGSIVNGAKLYINSTDTIMLPVGTSAQRPTSAGSGTDTVGMFRYNTTINAIEYYGGSTPGWQSVTSSFTVIADQQFNGTGAQVNFTLSSSQTTASCIVSINGIVQIPTLAYSVSGTTLTFTEAPANGDVIDVRMLTTTTTVTNLTSLNGYNSVSVDNNGVYITAGAAAATSRFVIDTSGNITISGNIIPSANLSYNLGNSTAWFGTFYGVSSQAKYADLAENYLADRTYAPGTVLMFGGAAEVTMADADTKRVAGVVSTNPAHLMNGALQGANVTQLALTGRVPCQVIGPVQKGDLMVSAGWGYAKVNNDAGVGQVIGKALEDFPVQAKGVIEVVVGRL